MVPLHMKQKITRIDIQFEDDDSNQVWLYLQKNKALFSSSGKFFLVNKTLF